MSFVEEKLVKYDPTFELVREEEQLWTLSTLLAHGPDFTGTPAEQFQAHLNVERIRVPEIIYQPSIVGVDQAGLAQAVKSALARYSEDVQRRLGENIFITGSNTLMTGFDERLRQELLEIFPFQTNLVFRRAKDCSLDAWRGASEWARSEEAKTAFVTRKLYDEAGHDYLAEHAFSNPYFRLGQQTEEEE